MFKFIKKYTKETSNNKPSFHLKINLSSNSFFNKAYSNLSIAFNILIGVKPSLPISMVISFSLIFTPTFSFAEILPDKNSPIASRPTILKTPNNAIQVDIVKPNNKGVSINEYSKFNTTDDGTILNNSRNGADTITGGYIHANPRLSEGSAKLIVNKINSDKKSSLKGNIEIAGDKADLMIANPSGIWILHPIDFVNDIYTAISNPLQTKDAIASSINEFGSKNFIDSIISDQNSINYRTYKIPGEILVPIGAVAKTSKIGKLKNVNVTGKIAKGADNAIISTSNGVIVLPKTLSKQGTSKFTGDFTGLEGATVEEIFSRVPKEWKMLPQNLGQGIKFVDKAGIERIRIHAPDIKAPIRKNSNVGWVLRIQADDKGKKFYNNSGNIVNRNSNDGHIPIYGNPNLNKQEI